VDSLLQETEALRALFRVLQGLSKEGVDNDLKIMRTEVREATHSLIEMCDNLQALFEMDCKDRRKDRAEMGSNLDEAQGKIQRLEEQCEKLTEGVLNVKDLTVVLMENSLIE
jgi:hypothetical protein